MTRINGNLYFCEWCSTEFTESPSSYISPDKQSNGKQNVTSAIKCPMCGRKVSQKLRRRR